MKFIETDEHGKSTIECQHCGHQILAFKPVRGFMVDLMFCAGCSKNTQGEIAPKLPSELSDALSSASDTLPAT